MSRASEGVPLVAREHELASLRRALDRAAAGRSTTVLVAGDAGVGKSRLVGALAQQARAAGAVVLVGHCIDLGGVGLPYLPFAQVLAAVDRLGAADADVRGAVGRRPVLTTIAGVAEPAGKVRGDMVRLQLFDAVSALLADLAAARPCVVLVLEDLHWADQSTRELLRYLIARAGDARLLVIGTYRSDDMHRRHPLRALLAELVRQPDVERVDVHPFTEPELRRFAAAVAGGAVDEPRLRNVLLRSEGNAYFAEELLEAEADSGLPERLTDVLAARVDRLGPAAQHLVRLASAAGRRVSEPLLQAVSELMPPAAGGATTAGHAMEEALRDAVAHRVLEPDDSGRYAFRHALLAEAVYNDLLPGERVRMHAAYAAAIRNAAAAGASAGTAADGVPGPGSLGSAAELAHHAMAGHDLPAALSASLAAADEATRRLAPAESLQHLETVLQLWDAVPDAVERAGQDLVATALHAAEAAGLCGELPRAVALSRTAVQEAVATGDGAKESVARRVLAEHLMSTDQPGVLAESARAVELLTGRPPRHLPTVQPDQELLLAAATHARGSLYADQDADAEEWARWALEGARKLSMPAVEAESLTTLAALSRDVAARRELLVLGRERAAAAGDLTAELRSTYSIAADAFYAGDTDAALTELLAGQRRAQATGITWSVWGIEMRAMEVVARYLGGDWEGSARASAPVGDMPSDLVAARLSAAALYVGAGRGEPTVLGAAERLRPAWRLDGQIALVAGGCLADSLTWQGRPEEAVVVAREVIEFLARTWDDYFLGGIWLSALALSALADIGRRRGTTGAAAGRGEADRFEAERDEADRLLAHATRTAGRGRPRGGVLGPEGRAWLIRAHAEHARVHGREGVAVWQAAVDAFAGWYPYEEARSRRRLAEALVTAGDRAGAGREARPALAIAERLGASPLREAVRDLSRRARLGITAATAAPSTVLTGREAEVLALVAQGLTNRAVGQALFISDKTVSVHLSNVMTKLGAGSRTEAVSVAHRRGLLATPAPPRPAPPTPAPSPGPAPP